MKNRWPAFILLLLVLVTAVVFLSFWSRGRPEAAPREKVRVVTTFLPLYIFTINVSGDLAEVDNLLPPGAGPHDYSFTSRDMQKIAGADLIVMNGLALDDWISEIVQRSGSRARVIDASQGIEINVSADGGADPHIWLDPLRARQMVRTITDGLSTADPENASEYRRRAEAYQFRLQALDQDYRARLNPLPRKEFIAFHSAFKYLAERYGLVQRAVIEEFPGKEPGARYLASIVDLIKREGVRAIFSEPQFSPKIVEVIAKETGLTVRELDTIEAGALVPETYEEAMRKNLETLVEAFSETAGNSRQ